MSLTDLGVAIDDLLLIDGDPDGEFIFISERGEQGLPGDIGSGLDEATAVELIDAAVLVEHDRAVAAESALDDALAQEAVARATDVSDAVSVEATQRATAVTAEQTRAQGVEATLIPLAQKNAANGVADLDVDVLLRVAVIPQSIARDAEVTAAIAAAQAVITAAYQAAIDTAIANLVGTAAVDLNTLGEISDALNDDADAFATLNGLIAAKQAAHANLTQLAGLNLVANKLLYANGAGTLALADYTAFGRQITSLADAAALRALAGLGSAALAASTDFDVAGAAAAAQAAAIAASQPLDADLTALAALATTAFGRSVLEVANAGALRTLAGLGTAALSAVGDFDAAGAAATAQTNAYAADKKYAGINTQAATYTLALGDAGFLVRMNNGGALTLSIPTDAAAAFAVGTFIDFQQVGAGQLTIAAVTPGTTTVTSTGATAASPKTRQQYAGGTLIKIAADSWTVIGDVV